MFAGKPLLKKRAYRFYRFFYSKIIANRKTIAQSVLERFYGTGKRKKNSADNSDLLIKAIEYLNVQYNTKHKTLKL